MNIAQALKNKNRLAGEVNRLKRLISSHNSRVASKPNKMDLAKLFAEKQAAVAELITLKAKINIATAPIAEKLIKLAELKGEIEWLQSLSTKEGTFVENASFRGEGEKVTYETYLNEVKITELTKTLQDEINDLQDSIDEFNYTTKI